MTPQEVAAVLLETYPSSALDVALEVVRRVSRQQALDAAVAAQYRNSSDIRKPRPDSASAITSAVCAYFDVTESDLASHSRRRGISRARQFNWALQRERLNTSFMELARKFHRDHTTITAGYARVDRSSSDWFELTRRLNALFGEQAEAAE